METKVKQRFVIKSKAQIKSKPTPYAAVALSATAIDGRYGLAAMTHIAEMRKQKREATDELDRIKSMLKDRYSDLFASSNVLRTLHIVYNDNLVFTMYRRPPYTVKTKKRHYAERICIR